MSGAMETEPSPCGGQQPTQTLIPTPVPEDLLRTVYASDQAIYPATPSYARLRSWVDACPDLSICFRLPESPPAQEQHTERVTTAAIAGVVIVLPLRRTHWEDLLVGRLKEAGIEPRRMFPPCGEEEEEQEGEDAGLHVYHIERFDATESEPRAGLPSGGGLKRRGFSEFALGEVMRRVRTKREWKVFGVSALTATPAGKRTFERLGFAPTGYRELFVAKDPEDAAAGGNNTLQPDMMCVYPGGEGVVPKRTDKGVVVSASEMHVKYGSSTLFTFA